MFKIQFCCIFVRYSVYLAIEKEIDMRIERYVFFRRCVFFSETSTSRRRNVVRVYTHKHTHSLKHTHQHTHTHVTGQQWLAGRVGPAEFFQVLQIFFDHKWSARIFWTARGSRNIRKYFQSVTNVFSCLCLYFYAGIMLQRFSMIRF